VASGTAGWNVARAYLSDELDQIRRSKEWHLPEHLADLGKLSQDLRLQIAERRELEESRRRLPMAKAELAIAQKRLSESLQTNRELGRRLAKVEGDLFEVREGESRFILPNLLALGVSDISSVNHTASVQFGPQSATLSPGQRIAVVIEKTHYIVTFAKENGTTASFTLYVKKS
jgi:hypothetical protein